MVKFLQHTNILLFILLSITSCTHVNPSTKNLKHPKLTLLNDSGYLTKQEVLPFLLEAGLTDTSDWWSKISNNDTLGQYYRSEKNGYYYMMVNSWSKRDSTTMEYLIELSKEGDFKGSIEAYGGNWSFGVDGNYYSDFHKIGKYFTTSFSPHGTGYFGTWIHIFDTLECINELSAIFTGCYSIHGGSNFNPQNIYSTYDIVDSICTVHYFIEEGVDDEKLNDIIWDKPTERIIKYKYDGKSWEAEDSSLLKGMDIYY